MSYALRIGAALATMTVCAIGSPAAATVTIDTTQSGVTLDFGGVGPGYADKIKNNSTPDGTTITLISDSGYLIDYIGTGLGVGGVLQAAGGGGGFAHVTGSNGQIGGLTIDPQGTVGFSAIDFNIGFDNGIAQSYHTGDISLYIAGQAMPVVFSSVLFNSNQNKFSVYGTPGMVFSAIRFDNMSYVFDGSKKSASFSVGSAAESMRQVSAEFVPGGVPEPSTWAMMLLGFLGTGMAVRRRRSLVNKVTTA